jgi:hypothetical protein
MSILVNARTSFSLDTFNGNPSSGRRRQTTLTDHSWLQTVMSHAPGCVLSSLLLLLVQLLILFLSGQADSGADMPEQLACGC